MIWNLLGGGVVDDHMNTPRSLLLVLLLSLLSSSVLAQSTAVVDEPPVEVRYETRTVLAIESADIVGTVSGPTGTRVVGGKRPRFRSLVTLRSNFRDALSSTSTSPSVSP